MFGQGGGGLNKHWLSFCENSYYFRTKKVSLVVWEGSGYIENKDIPAV